MAASPNFISGDHCTIFAGTTQLPGDSWTLAIDPKVKEAHNSRDGRKRIRGMTDATGEFHIWFDTGTGAIPTDPANAGLTDGAVVTLKLYIDSTHFFQLSAIIGPITPGVESVDGVAEFKVTFALASGSVTYPTIP